MALNLEGLTPLMMVYDMPASIRFYRDTLGFEIVSTSRAIGGEDHFGWAWLRLGDVDLMLNTAYEVDTERPAAPDPQRIAGHQDTVLYLGCRDVDAAYQHLLANGVSVNPPKIASYGMKQLYVQDPGGFELCFQWRADTAN